MLLVTAAPTIVLRSPLARPIFQRTVGGYGWEGDFESLRFGWITPLRLDGLRLHGIAAGTRVEAEQVDCGLTLLSWLGGAQRGIAATVQGLQIDLAVSDNNSSLETDLRSLLDDHDDDPDQDKDASPTERLSGSLNVHGAGIRIRDEISGEVWSIDQGSGVGRFADGKLTVELSGIVSETAAGSGSFEVRFAGTSEQPLDLAVELQLNGLPLRAAQLVRRRVPEWNDFIPERLSGDATGTLRIAATENGGWSLDARPLELRNLIVGDANRDTTIWRNDLATLAGFATLDGRGVTGEGFRLATDFAELTLDGSFLADTDLTSTKSLISWLAALDGTAAAAIDLLVLNERLPGFLPLRQGTQLVSGKLTGELNSRPNADGDRRVEARLRSEPIRARSGGRQVVVEPADLAASLRLSPAGQWRADRCELTSFFGTATLDGDLSAGRAQADFDLGRLATTLEPLIDLSRFEMAGTAEAVLAWSTRPDGQWNLTGDADATELTVFIPGGIHLHRPKLTAHVDANGRWGGRALSELTAAELSLRSQSLRADVVLAESVANPSASTVAPLRISGKGRLEALAEFIGPWLPPSLHGLRGGFDGDAEAAVGLARGEVSSARLRLDEPRIAWENRLYSQSELILDFAGQAAWPSGDLVAERLEISGEAISGTLIGRIDDAAIDLQLAWQTDLERLLGAVQTLVAQATPPPSNTLPGSTPGTRFASVPINAAEPLTPWQILGNCSGNARISRPTEQNRITIQTQAKAVDLSLHQAGETVWSEPQLAADGSITYDPETKTFDTEELRIQGEWASTSLAGQVAWNDGSGKLRLAGPARLDMAEVAQRLSTLAGTSLRLTGVHEAPLEIGVDVDPNGDSRIDVTTNLGWESGEIAGLALGPATVPLKASETSVAFDTTTIPFDQGRLTAAGELHYRPGPLWLDVRPGAVAQNIRLTPELSDRWLQYLAPMVARTTRIDGNVGVELDEAKVNFDEPTRSRVRGQLRISRVDFDAGPVAAPLITTIEQIRMLARGQAVEGQPAAPRTVKLATLPTQVVDFDFNDGVVTHQRMFMEIDRARLITSGQVNVDGRLNLIAQVPLEAAWLGSDLRALAGQSVTLPITGSLSQPRLDPSAVRNLAARLGAAAVQSTAENYLEKQLNRGLDRLLGK